MLDAKKLNFKVACRIDDSSSQGVKYVSNLLIRYDCINLTCIKEAIHACSNLI